MTNYVPPQLFPNHLHPITIDEPTLRRVLGELRAAVRRGVGLIQSKHSAPDVTENEEALGTIFSGSLGIALMYLRVEEQAYALSDFNHISGEFEPPLPDFWTLVKAKISPHPLELRLQPGRPSPLCSPSLGASVIRILVATHKSDPSIPTLNIKDDVAALDEAVQTAIHQEPVVTRNGHSMGGDEALYGRAGLLWALANLHKHNASVEIAQALQPVLELKSKLRDAVVDAGRRGSKEHARVHGETEAMPLMWPWLDDFYGLGGMHGTTGILTVLLGCEASESDYPAIGNTITNLCKICISHNGHLPMSIPPWPSSRSSPLVQICHGIPGLLLLLAAAKGTPGVLKYQTAEWDEAIRLGSERVWEEDLLSKGGGLCHGIAGNAWPWLLLHEMVIAGENGKVKPLEAGQTSATQHKTLSADYFLSRALAFLLAARDTQPFAASSLYRMPDNPFGLFEGLAGTICAWSEACAVITARLKIMQMLGEEPPQRTPREDESFAAIRGTILGFPGLGGMGPHGLL